MARRTVTITSCDICGATGADEFWADVTFRSKKYEYDDGTNPQNYDWTLCRGCKVKLLDFMDRASKVARKPRELIDEAVEAVVEAKKPKPRKPKGPLTSFERVSKGILPDG